MRQTQAQVDAAAVAFEERELALVVESARVIRVKLDAEQEKLDAADALVVEHRGRLAEARSRQAHGEVPAEVVPTGPAGSNVASITGSALDATVRIED